MIVCNWNVINIEDGCYDVVGITDALERARSSQSNLTFINVKTIIGIGSAVAGKAIAHGAALGAKDVANIKRTYGFNPDEHFVIGKRPKGCEISSRIV